MGHRNESSHSITAQVNNNAVLSTPLPSLTTSACFSTPTTSTNVPNATSDYRQCLTICKESFIDAIGPNHEDIDQVCNLLANNGSLLRTLYACDAACGITVSDAGQYETVDSIIAKCYELGFSIILNPSSRLSSTAPVWLQCSTRMVSQTQIASTISPFLVSTTSTLPTLLLTTREPTRKSTVVSGTHSVLPPFYVASSSSYSESVPESISASTTFFQATTISPIYSTFTPHSTFPPTMTLIPAIIASPSGWAALPLIAKIFILLSALIFLLVVLLVILLLWHRRTPLQNRRQRILSTSSELSFSDFQPANTEMESLGMRTDIGSRIREFRATTPPDRAGICWPARMEGGLRGESREMREWSEAYALQARGGDGEEIEGRRGMVLGGEVVRGRDGRWVREA